MPLKNKKNYIKEIEELIIILFIERDFKIYYGKAILVFLSCIKDIETLYLNLNSKIKSENLEDKILINILLPKMSF